MGQNSDKEKYPVLIVDDEPYIVDALLNYLENYKVDFAYDGHVALQKLASGNFKVVLTDIMMPGFDGIELLKEIKNTNPGIQVIMMTGHTTLMRAMESMQNGAIRYLVKPFGDIREVDAAIDEAIGEFKSWEEVCQKTVRAKNKFPMDEEPVLLKMEARKS